MSAWKGVVGTGFTADAFDAYVDGVQLGAWSPEFVVLHNTAIPTLADWHKVPGARRMQGLVSYYRDDQKWSGGPHLFVADDLIWVFTPLTVPGVHAPSWNGVAWGVETVGDYAKEQLTAAVRGNLVRALAALHRRGELDPDDLKLHKQDPKTTHKGCPGVYLASVRDEIVSEVKGLL